MTRDTTIAPKERINIVYRPSAGSEMEEVELPLKILVIGDFTGREHDVPVEDRSMVSVTKINYDDVLAAQDVHVSICVKNVIVTDELQDLPVHLKISELKDFTPDQIVKQVPELQKLMDLRAALTALKGPMGNVPTFRKTLQSMIDDVDTRERIINELKTEGNNDYR